jgi:hypothetical protein
MLEDLLKGLIVEAIGEDIEKQKKPIGKISEELRQEYINWRDEKEDFEAEVEFRMNMLKRKLERQLAEEFEGRHQEMTDKKEELWNKIKGELGIIGESDLNINPKTGLISKWVKKENNKRF